MATNKVQFDLQRIPLAKLVNNEGQIPDVQANPRTLTEKEYKKLQKKLRELDFTDARPLIAYPMGEQYVVFCGNQRLRALRSMGEKEVMCAVVPADTTPQDIRRMLLADNKQEGEWDMDMLANEWDAADIEWAGIDEARWEQQSEVQAAEAEEDADEEDEDGEYIGTHEDGEVYLVGLSFALKIAEYNAIKAKLNEIGGDKNAALLKLAGL